MAAMRKKHQDAVAELSDQIDAVQKIRAKYCFLLTAPS